MSRKGTYSNRRRPFLRLACRTDRGDLGVCLLAINLFITFSLSAQQSSVSQKTIYTGFDNPTSIYATQQHLFVVESGKHRILKLDHTGKLLETLGGLGTGNYQFDTPVDIDATNGLKIYVSDYRNNRVQVFDRRFQYLTTITAPREQRRIRPTQLVVNDFGELFFYDEASRSVMKYDENGVKIDEFKIPSAIREVSDIQSVGRNLYFLDLKSNHYHVLTNNSLQIQSYPMDGTVHLFVDKEGEEWLISDTSIKNSRETSKEIEFNEKLNIKDVVKANGLFYVLTNKSVLIIYVEN